MTGVKAVARYEAIEWAIRSRDDAFDEWEALANWLAADPHHAVLYDQVTIGTDEAARFPYQAETSPRWSPAVAPPRIETRRPGWLPFALAASLVAVVGGGLTWYRGSSAPALYSVATAAGGRHTVALAGAVRIDLNGGTRITLDRGNARFARLDRGEATFSVVHDPKHPFELHVADTVVTDVGTVFDVDQDERGVRVAVAEGAVSVATAGGPVKASAGDVIVLGKGRDAIVMHDDGALHAGAWRQGQIDFADVTLAQLAARLHRTTGASITVAPEVGGRKVSGSIALDTDSEAALKELGPLLGIAVASRGGTWVWGPLARAKPS